MSFSSVPPELISALSYFITSSSDLLAFALTSKRVHALVIPDHLHYRHICCDWHRGDLWLHLLANPEIGAHCRIITITNELPVPFGMPRKDPQLRLAPSLSFDSDLKRVRNPDYRDKTDPPINAVEEGYLIALESVIRQLPQLEIFQWSSPMAPPLKIFSATVGRHGGSMRGLQFRTLDGMWSSVHEPATLPRVIAKLGRLSNLTQLSLNNQYSKLEVEIIACFLLASPSLIDLYIHPWTPGHTSYSMEARTLFSTVRLPYLTRLTVNHFFLVYAHKSFFRSHPRLETLCIKGRKLTITSPNIVFADLPSLKSLMLEWTPQASQFSPEVLQGLECLEMPIYQIGSNPIFLLHLKNLLVAINNLTTLVIYELHAYDVDGLSPVLRCVPNLTRLCIGQERSPILFTQMRRDSIKLWDFFKLVPKLTHFAVVDLADWDFTNLPPGNSGYNDRHYTLAIQELCASALALEYIYFSANLEAVIRRSHGGEYESHRIVHRKFNSSEWTRSFLSLV